MKREKSGFTMVELLTVLAVITILVGLLIPALAMVRKIAKETQQKAQLTTIGLAIMAFKVDYGDYPPSGAKDAADLDYSGAQKLAEALLGWDLMGFHPDSDFRSDGEDGSGNVIYPDPLDPIADIDNLNERRELYLEAGTANAFKLEELFNSVPRLEPETFVLCDVFGVRRITVSQGETIKAGTPILYYRANTSSKDHIVTTSFNERIYNVFDNRYLVDLDTVTIDGTVGEEHPLGDSSNNYEAFYEYITDPKVAVPWPHRPDSYILITAGADGKYGTRDDICNF
ncbi:MAG: type II secretion system protein [Planctomycetota bacterium]|nr:MAG: type II secretion system protein [Planctomycetota bacterium]